MGKNSIKPNKIKNNAKKDITIKNLIPYIIAAIALASVVYYMLGPSEGYLHSDCVDTMTWAGATVDSGQIFSSTFCYPYLLPFGSTFLVYPFVKIFGFTMFAYRFSMIVFLAIFSAACYFTARGMGWSRNTALIALSVELIMVSSSVKLRELFWEHIIHYSLGAMLAFVLLALVFKFIKIFEENKYSFKKDKKVTVFAVLIFLWALLSAFDGLTTLALSSIPVIGALFFVIIFDTKHKILSAGNKDTAFTGLIIAVGTVIGTLLLSAMTKDIGTGYGDANSVISDGGEWSNNLLKFLQQWTSLLGADYKTGESITTAENIFAAVKMAGSLVLFFAPAYALFNYKKYNRYEKIFILFHWFMTAFVLYGYVFGNLSSVNWRLSPIICSAVFVNVMIWRGLWSDISLKRTAGIVSSLVILSCVITVGQIAAMPADYGRDNDHHKAIELLERNNLSYGYATYWNANILTLLSSSKVKVRDVNFDEPQPRKGWLNSDTVWFDDQPGVDEYFILLTNSEYERLADENHVALEDTERIIREGNWTVLVRDKNIVF